MSLGINDLVIPNGAIVFDERGLQCAIWDGYTVGECALITLSCGDRIGFVVTTVVPADARGSHMSLIITERYIGWAYISPGMVVRGPL